MNTAEVVLHSDRPPIPFVNLSSLPHLQHITIRLGVYYDDDSDWDEYPERYCISCLPSAVEILKTAASSLQQLTIEICVDDAYIWLPSVDFSPLTALVESFHHIDLYAMDISHNQMVSVLARYEGLKKLIEQGVLVIHAEEIAPSPGFMW